LIVTDAVLAADVPSDTFTEIWYAVFDGW